MLDASSFGQALIASRLEQLNPMNRVMGDLMAKQVSDSEDELIRKTSQTVELLEAKLEAAVERQARPAVIAAYEKLLIRAQENI